MKTLFLYAVQIYLFYSCTCIFGIPQPRPDDSSRTLSSVENIIKKCQEVTVVIKSDYLDPGEWLCFGVKALSQRIRDGLQESDVEKIYDGHICEHFNEMKLNSTQDKLNESSVYNRQFANKTTCEKSCLDFMGHVNPLCKVILLLSHYSKANTILSGTTAPSTMPSDNKLDNENNEVSEQSKNYANDVPNISLHGQGQKTKANDVEQANAEQKTGGARQQEKTVKTQKLQQEDQLVRQDLIRPQAQTSQGNKSPSTNGAPIAQQTDLREVGSVEGKINVEHEVTETAKEQTSTIHLPVVTGGIIPDNNAAKKATNTKTEPKASDVEDTNLVVDGNNEGESDSLLQENEMPSSSVVLPLNSDGSENELGTATRAKMQEKIGNVEERLTSDKVVINTDLKEDERSPQIPKVKEDKGIANGEKSQANNKETENTLQEELKLQMSNKKTDVKQKSKTDEQKMNRNNGKAHTNDNVETEPQLGRSDIRNITSDDGHSASDTGNGVAEPDSQFSGDAGELNDNTEIYSGGGTAVESDVFESGINANSNAGAILYAEREMDDDDSHFFSYLMTTMVFCIVGYLLFHNKQKILALALEGRARRSRRRPNTSGYRKLDSNLEEAISSSKGASATQVIY